MSLGKSDIVKNISTKAHLTISSSSDIFESFVFIIKSNIHLSNIKISNFGTFQSKISPRRMGRNPKTKELHPIPKKNKITFIASNTFKNLMN